MLLQSTRRSRQHGVIRLWPDRMRYRERAARSRATLRLASVLPGGYSPEIANSRLYMPDKRKFPRMPLGISRRKISKLAAAWLVATVDVFRSAN